MAVTKTLRTTYKSILQAKLYFFFRKSIWMYLLGMFLLAYVFPMDSYGLVISAVIYFILFIVVILAPVYHFSAKRIVKNRESDMVIEFSEQVITIKYEKTGQVETRGWDWIKEIKITPNELLLIVYLHGRYLIAFPKDKLSETELQFFLNKAKDRTGLL